MCKRTPLQLKVRCCERSLYAYRMCHAGPQVRNQWDYHEHNDGKWKTDMQKDPANQLRKNSILQNSKPLNNALKAAQMATALLSNHSGCINVHFSGISCLDNVSRQKTAVDAPATANNTRAFWLSAELQSVVKQLPLASSNDTFYRCRALPSQWHLHYDKVPKNMTLSLCHLHTS